MKRVYTDNRFPGLEIVNEGDTTFKVVIDGKSVSSFASWESGAQVSEAFAQRRADDYFKRLSEAQEFHIPDELDHTDIFNNPAPEKVSSREIDRLMAQEKMERDPQRKQQLRQRVLLLMRQEESAAEAVVSHLIESF